MALSNYFLFKWVVLRSHESHQSLLGLLWVKENLTSVRTKKQVGLKQHNSLCICPYMPRMKTNRYVPVCFTSTLSDKYCSSLMRLYEVTAMQELNPTSTAFFLDPEMCVVTAVESAGWLKRGGQLLHCRMRSGAMSRNEMGQTVSNVVREMTALKHTVSCTH